MSTTVMKKIIDEAIKKFKTQFEFNDDTIDAITGLLQTALNDYAQQIPKSETKELLTKLSEADLPTPTRPTKPKSGNAWSQFLHEQADVYKARKEEFNRAQVEKDYNALTKEQKAELKARAPLSKASIKPRNISAYTLTQKYVKEQIEERKLKDTVKYADVISVWIPKSKMTFEEAKDLVDQRLDELV